MIMLIITLRMTTITSEAAVTELANIFSNWYSSTNLYGCGC